MQLCFWNSQPSDIIIRMAAFTTYQHCYTFSCSRNGPQILFHVILPSMYSNHSEIQKWHVPKNSLCTDILPLEVSYLYWYENTLYIWYFCELHTTWLISNFYFWTVFSHVIWFDVHHIVGIWYVIYISGEHIRFTNYNCLYMQIDTHGRSKFPQFWKVWNVLFWVGRVLQISPQKLEEFPPYSYSHQMCFDVPPLVGVWDIITISGDLSDWQIITSIHIYHTV